MTKLLKHSILALVLVLGSSTYAHAETIALANGGIGGVIQDVIDWLFHLSSDNNNHSQTTTYVAPEIDPDLTISSFLLLGGTLTVLRSRRSTRRQAS
jgi:hypothetical protein